MVLFLEFRGFRGFRRDDGFRQNIGGSIGPLMALMFVPVLGIALTALDYNRADGIKGSMQAATDAAATAAAQQLGEPGVNIADIVRGYLKANLPKHYRDHSYALTVAPDNSALSIRMTDSIPTTLLSFAGVKKIEIVAESRAERPKVAVPETPEAGHGADNAGLREVQKALGLSRPPSEIELRQAETEARRILQELERGGDLPPELERMLGQLR